MSPTLPYSKGCCHGLNPSFILDFNWIWARQLREAKRSAKQLLSPLLASQIAIKENATERDKERERVKEHSNKKALCFVSGASIPEGTGWVNIMFLRGKLLPVAGFLSYNYILAKFHDRGTHSLVLLLYKNRTPAWWNWLSKDLLQCHVIQILWTTASIMPSQVDQDVPDYERLSIYIGE